MKTLFAPLSGLPGIVAGIGFFDGVHTGHRALIEAIKNKARQKECASAVVTFRRHPREVLSSDYRPVLINTFEERIQLLSQTGIDYTIVLDFDTKMSEMTSRDFMIYLRDHYNLKSLYIGYDHRFGHNRSEGFDDYLRHGKEVGVEIYNSAAEYLGHMPISSSAVRRFLLEGDVEHASQMLSYDYFLSGKVVAGYGIGRKIGFRTANIEVEDVHKLIPGNGVYAVYVTLPDKTPKKGMLNIGNRPTVHNSTVRFVEVHIFDYEGDLYDKTITISFAHYIRDERKMADVETLKKQLEKDKEKALSLLKQ